MPADTETFFTVRGAAWHDQDGSHDHQEYPSSIAQAREWAGQDWEYVEAPTFERKQVEDPATFEYRAGDEVVTAEDPDDDSRLGAPVAVFRPIPAEKRILRSDTGAHLITVPTTYEVIGLREMWEFVEAVSDQPNVKFETGGVLTGGRRVWALARLDEPWHAPGDASPTFPYVVFLNAVDRQASAKVVSTTVRVVCANTFGMADAEGRRTGREFFFRHVKGVHDRIEEAKQALRGVREDTRQWQQLATDLALLPVDDRQRELFVREFVPSPPDGLISDRVAANIEEARQAIRAIMASPTCDGIRGNALELVQGAGEYLDHVRGARTFETRLRRQLLAPEPLKAKAVKLAREVVATG